MADTKQVQVPGFITLHVFAQRTEGITPVRRTRIAVSHIVEYRDFEDGGYIELVGGIDHFVGEQAGSIDILIRDSVSNLTQLPV